VAVFVKTCPTAPVELIKDVKVLVFAAVTPPRDVVTADTLDAVEGVKVVARAARLAPAVPVKEPVKVDKLPAVVGVRLPTTVARLVPAVPVKEAVNVDKLPAVVGVRLPTTVARLAPAVPVKEAVNVDKLPAVVGVRAVTKVPRLEPAVPVKVAAKADKLEAVEGVKAPTRVERLAEDDVLPTVFIRFEPFAPDAMVERTKIVFALKGNVPPPPVAMIFWTVTDVACVCVESAWKSNVNILDPAVFVRTIFPLASHPNLYVEMYKELGPI
jgi:hypothetical protein